MKTLIVLWICLAAVTPPRADGAVDKLRAPMEKSVTGRRLSQQGEAWRSQQETKEVGKYVVGYSRDDVKYGKAEVTFAGG